MRELLKKKLEKRSTEALVLLAAVIVAGTAVTASTTVLDTGSSSDLVAEYRFDTGAGDTVYDTAGNNDGTINGASWTDGVEGSALDFDGGDSVNAPLDMDTAEITLSFWLKETDSINDWNDYLSIEGSNSRITPEPYDGEVNMIIRKDGNNYDAPSASIEESWTHYSIVLSSSQGFRKTYKNGQLVGTSDGWPGFDSNNIYMGSGTTSELDNVRVYSKALNNSEISSIYNSGSWRVGQEEDSVRFDKSEGFELYNIDESINGQKGWSYGSSCSEDGCYVTNEKSEDGGKSFKQTDGGGDLYADSLIYNFDKPLTGDIVVEGEYWEKSSPNYDGNFWVKACDGSNLAGIGTENPQFEADVNNTEVYNNNLGGYQDWVNVRMDIDTRTGDVKFSWEQDNTGASATHTSNFGPDHKICEFGVGPGGTWYVDDISIRQGKSKVLDMSFSEQNSTHVYDTSGQNNHGQSAASQESAGGCKVGRCYNFDGDDDYVSVDSDSSLEVNHHLTVSSWVYPESSGWKRILMKGEHDEYLLDLTDNEEFRFRVYDSGGGAHSTYSQSLPLNQWYHVTGVYDGSKVKLYLGGRKIDESSFSGDLRSTSYDMAIGSSTDYSGSWGDDSWDGRIDQVKVFNRSLSQQEIIQATEGLSSDGAVLNMRFNDKGGDHVEDISNQDNHGRLLPNESNGPEKISGVIGEALEFDGSDDTVDIADSESLNLSSNSVSLWVKSENLPTNSNSGWLALKKDSGNEYEISLSVDGDSHNFVSSTEDNDNRVTATSSTEFQAGKWFHVVGTWDEQDKVEKIYVNGELEDSASGGISIPDTTEDLTIGSGWGSYFSGTIDQLKIYPYEVSESKVQQLYRRGKSNVGSSTEDDSSSTDLQDGLVLSQTFNRIETCGRSDTVSCPSGVSGEVAVDESGEANHGELVNGPTEKSGGGCKVAGCLNLEESGNEYVSVNDDQKLDGSSGFAISFWFRPDESYTSLSGGWHGGISKVGSSDRGYSLAWDGWGDNLDLMVWNGSRQILEAPVTKIEKDSWHHFVGVYEPGERAAIYKDGKLFSEDTNIKDYGDISTSGELEIGKDSQDGNILDGNLDQVRIYNRSLSDQEAWKLYTRGRDRESGMAGPVGWWRMDEDTSSVNAEQRKNSDLGANGNGNTVSLETVSFDNSGWYKVSYGSTWHSETAGGRHYMKNWLQNSGSTVTPSENRCYIRNNGNGDSCSNSGTVLVNANSGDNLELIGTKHSGSGGETIAVEDHYLYVKRVSNPVGQVWDTTGGQNYDSGTITVNMDSNTVTDSAYSFSSSGDYLQVNEDGLYKAYYSVNNDDTGQGNRQIVDSWLRINGNSLPQNPTHSYSYLRNTGSFNHQTGAGILDLNANDYVQIRQEKEHQQTPGSSETEPDRNWLLLEKLPTENLLQVIERNGGQRISDGATESIDFDTDLIEGDRYTHSSGDSKAYINETGWYEISYSFTWDDENANGRHIFTGWLRKNGDQKLLPSEQRDYTRGCCSGRKNTITSNTFHKLEKGDYIELMAEARGGYGDVVGNGTYMTITPVQGAPDAASDNHGLVEGDPVWKSGKQGKAMEFDGNDDYVDISNGIVSQDQDLSVSFWSKPNSIGAARPLTLRGDVRFVPDFESDGEMDIWVDGNWHTGLASYSANRWSHWSIVYRDTINDWKVFKNGELVATFNDDLADANNNNVIGADWWSSTDNANFNGNLKDVRIYPYALNSEQVKQVMNSGAASVE